MPSSSLPPRDGIFAMTRLVAGLMRSTSSPRWVTTQIDPKPLATSLGESPVATLAATYRGGAGELGVDSGAVCDEVAVVVGVPGADARELPPLLHPPSDDVAAADIRTTTAIGTRAHMSTPPPTADSPGL